MSIIYSCGGAGGLAGALLGGWLGGVPGAATLGQLFAGAGLEVGKWAFGADLGKHVVEQVLDKTMKGIARVEKTFVTFALPCGIYWHISKSIQQKCALSSQDWDCYACLCTNAVLLVYSAGTAIYLMRKTSSNFLVQEPVQEMPLARIVRRDSSATDNESKKTDTIFSRTSAAISSTSHKSKNASRGICASKT